MASPSIGRVALTCALALAGAPPRLGAAPSAAPAPAHKLPPPGDFTPRRLLHLDRCPAACTLGIEDLAAIYVTIRIPF